MGRQEDRRNLASMAGLETGSNETTDEKRVEGRLSTALSSPTVPTYHAWSDPASNNSGTFPSYLSGGSSPALPGCFSAYNTSDRPTSPEYDALLHSGCVTPEQRELTAYLAGVDGSIDGSGRCTSVDLDDVDTEALIRQFAAGQVSTSFQRLFVGRNICLYTHTPMSQPAMIS